ncbi:MAG: hypothetical protein K8F25_16115 [Fimbriimonadaceae bacterium]|nr:hypothetical protein [Alphaproteobacteria bacterium]
MFVFRFLGLCLVAIAFIALVVDGTKSIAASTLYFTPLGEGWFSLHPPSLNLFQAIVERYTFPFIWDSIIIYLLLLPVWVVIAALGLLLLYIGRRRLRRGRA